MGPDWFVLIGVVVIVIGFLLKIDAIAVVIVAAMTTSLISGVSFWPPTSTPCPWR